MTKKYGNQEKNSKKELKTHAKTSELKEKTPCLGGSGPIVMLKNLLKVYPTCLFCLFVKFVTNVLESRI